MRKLCDVRVVISCGLALIGGLLLVGLNQAQARPKYRSVFKITYPNVVRSNKKITCAVCHVVMGKKVNKKKRNNYGMALRKALGKKNVKKSDVIKKALKSIESGKSAVAGKTFGDLLKAGKLPASK